MQSLDYATLSAKERLVLERIVDVLRLRLGDALVACGRSALARGVMPFMSRDGLQRRRAVGSFVAAGVDRDHIDLMSAA